METGVTRHAVLRNRRAECHPDTGEPVVGFAVPHWREILELARRQHPACPEIRALVRTGDTPAKERQQMVRRPPHILVTTPESLYLLLTGKRSREILRHVETVIIDEIHAIAMLKESGLSIR